MSSDGNEHEPQPETGRLCIDLKLFESFVVRTASGEVWIKLIRVKGKRAKVTVEAPKSIAVLRESLV